MSLLWQRQLLQRFSGGLFDNMSTCLTLCSPLSHSLSLSLWLSIVHSLSHTFVVCSLHSHRPFLIFQLLPFFPFFTPLEPCLLFPIPSLCFALTAVTLLSPYLSSFVVFRLVSPTVCCYQTYFRCDSPWLIDNMTKPRLSSTCSQIPRDKCDPIDICGPAWRLRLCRLF